MFVRAYVFMYGGTKKNARYIFEKADEEYIDLIIKCHEKQSRLAYYED